ncbi:hypothetical protein MTsPCn9_29320 [Croceitalea sp. MTPC9]|uniref:universal stress protein n=1 Tax=unclassified Croceitalea TaxID=2632280 RepID=UPI002B3D0994|nr:hypothetical protein MTsPCn6_30810 [Croceitalea sp. MTPC6]GMN17992.1 hypothetical protein MTsPCn9_29320 [Croceitalea sp. MTPC9]
MKKILLPTDFSGNAWNAITYALEFFKDETCLFYILHTYTPAFYRADYAMGGPAFSAIPDAGVERAQAGLENTSINIEQKFKNPNHQFKTLSAFNTLTDEIRDVTNRENIDLVVMGTQGATGAKEIFLGTHTVHAIRKSKIPVLVVPSGYVFKTIKDVLFPSDYKTSLNKKELQFLIEVVQLHNAKVKILNVNDKEDFTEDQKTNKKLLTEHLKSLDCSFEQIKDKLMPDAVHEYIAHHNIGLLAMMNRKHSFLERLLVKQNVDAIGYHTTIPFLVIPHISEQATKESKA